MYLTEFGEKIDREEGQLYISTDNGMSWEMLHEVISKVLINRAVVHTHCKTLMLSKLLIW